MPRFPVRPTLLVLFALTASILAAHSARAASDPVRVIKNHEHLFLNADCEKTNSCNLQKFVLKAQDYRIQVSTEDINFGTRMAAMYQTRAISQLEEFGIAQFIQGCQFSSTRLSDGRILKRLDISRPFYGQQIPYRHPKMVIDNFTHDPINWGENNQASTRHYYYFFLANRTDSPFAPVPYFGKYAPESPILMVRDRPGSAFFDSEYHSAKNISLKFKTCIYKTADVPRAVEAENTEFAKPLACLDWASSYIYNHQSGIFESPNGIDPFCFSSAFEEIR